MAAAVSPKVVGRQQSTLEDVEDRTTPSLIEQQPSPAAPPYLCTTYDIDGKG